MTEIRNTRKFVPLRYNFSRPMNVQDFQQAIKKAFVLSTLQLSDIDQFYFKSLSGHKKALRFFLRKHSNIILGALSFKKLYYSISKIKSQGSISLKFANKKKADPSKSPALHFILKVFLLRQKHNYLKQLSILYANSITNLELKLILDVIFCIRGLKNLRLLITNLQNNSQHSKQSRHTSLFHGLQFMKNLEKFLLLGTNLTRDDFQSYVSKLSKLPKLKLFSFIYDSENFSKTSVEDMENLRFRFNTALKYLASRGTLTDVFILIRSLFKGHEKEILDQTALFLLNSTQIRSLFLEVSFFDLPINILENIGKLPQLQTLGIKLHSKFPIEGENFLNGINKLEPLKTKISTLVLDLSEVTLSSIWSKVYQALKNIFINFKMLKTFSLLLGQYNQGLVTTLEALFESLEGAEANISDLSLTIVFENIEMSFWECDFLHSLINLTSMKHLSLDFQFKNLKNKGKRPCYLIVLDKLMACVQSFTTLLSFKIKLRGLNTPSLTNEILSVSSIYGIVVPEFSMTIGDLQVTQKDIHNKNLGLKNDSSSNQIIQNQTINQVSSLKQFLK